jgi:hypothetical protein
LFLAPAFVSAATPDSTTAPAVQAVVDCRKLADDTARLACYDKAADALGAAEANGDVVSLDRTQRAQVRKEAFGFALPSLTVLDKGEKPEAVDRIDDVVASAGQTPDGKWVIRMQSGAVWRQIDDYELARRPKPGMPVVIKRASLGSYMANVDGQPALRMHRDQ